MILNIIDKMYENSNFKKYLIIAFIILILLLIIVYIIGRIEYKKKNAPKKETEEELKDITFDLPPESANIKEDVTFEMPVLTRNLEDFKKSLEEEIEKEEEIMVRKTSGAKVEKETKAIKILDKDVIEDTAIVSLKNIELANQDKDIKLNKEANTAKAIEAEDFAQAKNDPSPFKKEKMVLETIEISKSPSPKAKSSEPILKIIDTEVNNHPKKAVNSKDSIYDTSDDF